ncbi:MAG TPA: hypothetical protein VMT68_16860 [Caulobacteraceae bacterium]|nr:hypothetical protein [Caulobacteraceae bacterium]
MAQGPALAFGTINWLGQHAEHEHITRWGLADAGFGPATLDVLAGKTGTFGAVGAPDRPDRGLLDVKAAHCDGGDHLDRPGYPQSEAEARARLQDCRAWIFANLDRAAKDAGGLAKAAPASADLDCALDGQRRGSAKCLVLEDLGLALHATQDFYAHTNWVDRPAPGPITVENPPGLGHEGSAPWLDPTLDAPFPAGLISGCYDGFPETRYCGAGGPNPRVQHRNLNKDEGVIDERAGVIHAGETPRGRVEGNFQRAVAAAVADTKSKWAFFEARVRQTYGPARAAEVLCLIRADRPSAC